MSVKTTKAIREGLEGVVVGNSGICVIDGHAGSLRYRGIDISDLAEHSTFEETVYLLWHDELPSQTQLEAFKAQLASLRELDDNIWHMLSALPSGLQPMEALRSVVSVLGSSDPDRLDNTREANARRAMRLVAKMPTILAYYYRHHMLGKGRVHPDPALGHAANFLYMLRGERPTPLQERAMDLALVLMAEHEMNASTFAARVTASTLSDMYSAISSAIGTLKGPLHGGANQRAMEMLMDIGEITQVEPYIDAALSAKQRIMGFGHRIYKVIDPRAIHLRDMLEDLCLESGDLQWHRLAEEVAQVVSTKKDGLHPNVDFFAAPLMFVMGVPVDLFTPIFAISRTAGWTAHVMEQYQHNRLLRPVSNYIGQVDRNYTHISQRNGNGNGNGNGNSQLDG